MFRAVREANGTFLGTAALDAFFKPCAFWPRGTIDPDFYKAPVSEKPVLVLSGDLDPVLPPARGEQAAKSLANARHVVVFQHHPWFIKSATEADQYFNIPLARRAAYLSLFREFGVRYLFCGHYHRNAEAKDGELENITSGPVGKPLGGAKSGIRVAIVRDDKIEHRYYELGELPVAVDVNPVAAAKKKKQ